MISILTRPYGRMLPPPNHGGEADIGYFNPHPPLRADATRRFFLLCLTQSMFQS